MKQKNRDLAAKWSSGAPYLLSVLRIMSAFMLIPAGTMKLFAFPVGMPPDGGVAPMMSQIWMGTTLIPRSSSRRSHVALCAEEWK